MTEPTLYRITDVFGYLEREDEYTGLTLEEAAVRMDDLTGCGEDVILSDWDEPCERCEGSGALIDVALPAGHFYPKGTITKVTCPHCSGDGKWPGPWESTDEETGREVTMAREVG